MNYRRGPEAPVMRYTLASLVSRKAVIAGASAAEGVFRKALESPIIFDVFRPRRTL